MRKNTQNIFKRINSIVENNSKKYIEFLRKIIKTNSYNPPGNEDNIAKRLSDFFYSYKIDNEIHTFDRDKNRSNFLATLNNNDKTLLYNGHMDVVPSGKKDKWRYDPLSAHLTRKYIYGRGATDMKGSLVAMAIALTILKELKVKTHKNLCFLGVADEETSGRLGSKWSIENILKRKKIKPLFTIIGEPTSLSPLPKSIVVGEKGHIKMRITTYGESCHSSIPFKGYNAIDMMGNIIQNLKKLDDYIDQVPPPMSKSEIKKEIGESFSKREIFEKIYKENELLRGFVKSLHTNTKSINLIEGGFKDNVVPEKCQINIDFRNFFGVNSKIIKNTVIKIIKNECNYVVREKPKGSKDICVTTEIYEDREPSFFKDWKENENIPKLKNIINKVYDVNPFITIYPATTDAHYFRNSNYCRNTVLFGCGNASLAHSVNEKIKIDDFLNAIKVYSLFGYRFLTDNGRSHPI